MKSSALVVAFIAIVISVKSQVYFNRTYRDTTRYTEIATNVIRSSSDEYLVANPLMHRKIARHGVRFA
jgi:hypothetical protein